MIKVEGVVTDDVGMAQHLDVQEVLLQLQVMLLLHPHHLHRINLPTLHVFTGADERVTALSYLL